MFSVHEPLKAVAIHCKNMRVALTNFGYIICNVHRITPYLKHIDTFRRFRRYEMVLCQLEYPLTQNVLLESFPIIVIVMGSN